MSFRLSIRVTPSNKIVVVIVDVVVVVFVDPSCYQIHRVIIVLYIIRRILKYLTVPSVIEIVKIFTSRLFDMYIINR